MNDKRFPVNRLRLWPEKKRAPQRLKPNLLCAVFGMTEVMPCCKANQLDIFRNCEAA
jgi:hypothetical protein